MLPTFCPKDQSLAHLQNSAIFPHQCPIPKTSSVNAAIVEARALTEALTNPDPAASFTQFGDAKQQAIAELSKIFENAIENPAPPIGVPPQLAVLTVPPPSPRVTMTQVPPRVTIIPVPPRVTIPPVPLRVPLPVHSNFIDPTTMATT